MKKIAFFANICIDAQTILFFPINFLSQLVIKNVFFFDVASFLYVSNILLTLCCKKKQLLVTELSMGQLDQARTRKCKPKPGASPKII